MFMISVPTLKVKVAVRSKVKIVSSKTTEANLMKLNRKIENYEKVCHALEKGSYAQCEGHDQVRGQIVPKIVLLINY